MHAMQVGMLTYCVALSNGFFLPPFPFRCGTVGLWDCGTVGLWDSLYTGIIRSVREMAKLYTNIDQRN